MPPTISSKPRYPRLDKCLFNVTRHIRRQCSIKRQVATFGANNYFVTGEPAFSGQAAQRFANRPFTALKAIVLRPLSITLAPSLTAWENRSGVKPVGFVVSVAEIGSDADGRQPKDSVAAEK